MTTPYVIGIGNAVMDVIAPTSDATLARLGVEKGIMQLIDRERSEFLMAAQSADPQAGKARLVPGGSVANTLAGLGMMGLRTAFIGKVAGDPLGLSYAEQTEAQGTVFVNPPVAGEVAPTSRSIIFVTPDVNPATFSGCDWLFLEGYLFDKDAGKAAFLKAAEACHAAGGQAGIALSDPFCVDRHREGFRRLVAGPMDYVIGNVHEWQSLYQVTDLEQALQMARADCGTVICTRSGEDAILIRGEERVTAPVHRVVPVDATGAGDQFAAGLILGLARGLPLAVAGRMGCIAAAEVISHVGPRPESDLLAAFRAEGLI